MRTLSVDAKINDYISRSFRDVADDDYVAARALYRVGLDRQFLWSALQAIEKYLKSILLYHRVSTKQLGHNIKTALNRVRAIPDFQFEISQESEAFIERLKVFGKDRYFEHLMDTDGLGLLELDKAVSEIRKFCRAVRTTTPQTEQINGRLEEIAAKPSRARDDLIWKNLYFGRFKKIRFSRRLKWANPSNFIFPEIFPELDKLIQFSKPVGAYFLKSQAAGKKPQTASHPKK